MLIPVPVSVLIPVPAPCLYLYLPYFVHPIDLIGWFRSGLAAVGN